MDSNTGDGIGRTDRVLRDWHHVADGDERVSASYTYTSSSQHYKAGVIVERRRQLRRLVHAARQPRPLVLRRRRTSARSTTTSATKLDAQSTRYVYTASTLGTGADPLAFHRPRTREHDAAGAHRRVRARPQATNVINWMLSARFGRHQLGPALTKLGAIQNSTPAILKKPFRPNWYTYLNATEKCATTRSRRPTRQPHPARAVRLDGRHAPRDHHAPRRRSRDSRAGAEAWAFVPPYVGSATSDYNASCTPRARRER